MTVKKADTYDLGNRFATALLTEMNTLSKVGIVMDEPYFKIKK